MVNEFFEKQVKKEEELRQELRNAETGFGFEDDREISEALERVKKYMKKMFKILNKVRQLKLTFTIEDERLIALVDGVNEDQSVGIEEIEKELTDNTVLLTKLREDFEELGEKAFEDAGPELNKEIQEHSKRYVRFFNAQDTSTVETFYLLCYLYRNEKFNDTLDNCANFLNLILKKINIYKTTLFVKFYEEKIITVMRGNIQELNNYIFQIVEHNSPVSEFERLFNMTLRTSVLISFIKSMIVSKKHDDMVFASPYLRQRLPAILAQQKEFEVDVGKIQKELGHVDNFINMLPDYLRAANDLEKMDGKVRLDEEYNQEGLRTFNTVLQTYNLHKSKFENLKMDDQTLQSVCLTKLRDILDRNNEIYERLKGMFFKLKVSRYPPQRN